MTVDDWIFEPRDFIRYLRSVHPRSVNPLRLPSRAVLVFGRHFFESCANVLRARAVDWNPGVAVGRAGKCRVAVVRSSIGAPAASIDLEEAIALGARTILAFGSCGSLREDLPIGLSVLPTKALSDEGTSKHYGGTHWAHPDPSLVRRIRRSCVRRSFPVREGAVWTTDAVYRESRSRVRGLVRRGVLGVEMEASALFTIGRCRGARIASLLVVSDELAGDVWKPGFHVPDFREGVQESLKVVVDVMSGALP